MATFSRLSTRYDNEIMQPTELDLRYAIVDLFNGIDPVVDEAPSAWFGYGHTTEDSTSFHTLTVERSGIVRFEFWPDGSTTPEFEYTAPVTEAEAHLLWLQLSKQKTDAILSWFLSRQ